MNALVQIPVFTICAGFASVRERERKGEEERKREEKRGIERAGDIP